MDLPSFYLGAWRPLDGSAQGGPFASPHTTSSPMASSSA